MNSELDFWSVPTAEFSRRRREMAIEADEFAWMDVDGYWESRA